MTQPETSSGAAGVVGIGVDLVDVARVRAAMEKWDDHFRNRVFLPAEQAYCRDHAEPWPHYAARWAAKEAVAKALGTGIGGQVQWLDIEVVRTAAGAPEVRLAGGAAELARARGVGACRLSLSHTQTQALAFVVLSREEPI